MAARAASLGLEVLFVAQVPPGLADDSPTIGAREGNRWHDQAADVFYLCSSAAAGAAKWNRLALPGADPDRVPFGGNLGSAAYADLDAMRARWPATHNAAYQITPVDWSLLLLTTANTNTWTLPASADVPIGWWFAYKNRSGNNLTIAVKGADLLDGVNANATIATAGRGAIAWSGAGFETH